MSTQNNGGAAFPVAAHENHWGESVPQQTGMTLRDYFAANAMQGMLAYGSRGATPVRLAKDAYAYADAMLAEREKRHD